MKEKTIVGITGMPGSGKDAVREIVGKLSFSLFVMGDEVRAEARRRNLSPTPENLGKIMLQMRAEEGPSAVAKRCMPKIKASTASVVVIDGVRSMEEVEEFRKEFLNFKIVAIHASPRTRFERLLKRNRSDDPKDWKTFIERSQRELGVGIGAVIASADYMIINEGTIEQFRRNVKLLFERGLKDERIR